MMKIYTRRGDEGTTGIRGGERVLKTDPRIEANGALDELNCTLGIVRSLLHDSLKDEMLREIQSNLMTAMSVVATPSAVRGGNPRRLPADAVEKLEQMLDEIAERGCMSHDFILPGGCVPAAFLHQARAVCRRAERRLWRLNEDDRVEKSVLCYVNRLSDLLFSLAREVNCEASVDDERWNPFNYRLN